MRKLVFTALFASVVGLAWLAPGIIETLGLRQADAEAGIIDHLAGQDYGVPWELSQAFKKIPAANRAATVRALGDFAKAYTKSPAGITAYRKRVGGGEPNPEQAAQYEEIVKQLKESVTTLEKSIAEMPVDQRPMMQPSLDGSRQAVKMYERMRDDAKQGATPKGRIAEMLEKFLTDTANMPWDAKLVPSGSYKIFADPKLEGMDRQRKFYFRCGRETVETARSYAQAWLKEM